MSDSKPAKPAKPTKTTKAKRVKGAKRRMTMSARRRRWARQEVAQHLYVALALRGAANAVPLSMLLADAFAEHYAIYERIEDKVGTAAMIEALVSDANRRPDETVLIPIPTGDDKGSN